MSGLNNATELLGAANERACITGEWSHTVRSLRKEPWKWRQPPRLAIRKRKIAMSRAEVLAACFIKEKTMSLSVTGTAEFKEEGKLLETIIKLQPHLPMQHEMLERVAKLYAQGGVTLEQGQLVMRRTLVVPALEAPEQPAERVVPENTVLSADAEKLALPAGVQEQAPADEGQKADSQSTGTEQPPAASKRKIDQRRGGKEID